MKKEISGTTMRLLEKQGWMKTADVAEYLGTSPNNVRNMLYNLRLHAKKFYGRWYFKKSDIDNLLTFGG